MYDLDATYPVQLKNILKKANNQYTDQKFYGLDGFKYPLLNFFLAILLLSFCMFIVRCYLQPLIFIFTSSIYTVSTMYKLFNYSHYRPYSFKNKLRVPSSFLSEKLKTETQ
jgi:hypothetical protein